VGFTSRLVEKPLGISAFPIDNCIVTGQSEKHLNLSEKYLILSTFLPVIP